MFKPTASPIKVNLLEEDVLRFWKSHHIFQKAVPPTDAPAYLLLEQPPAACTRPALAEARPFLLADALARYQRMRGRNVLRRAGWQAHGMRVETRPSAAWAWPPAAGGGLRQAASTRPPQGGFHHTWNGSAFGTQRLLAANRAGLFDPGRRYTLAVWGRSRRCWRVTCCTRRSAWHSLRALRHAASEWEIALGSRRVEGTAAYVRLPLVEDPATSLLAWALDPGRCRATLPWPPTRTRPSSSSSELPEAARS
jgi:hypothetical protein